MGRDEMNRDNAVAKGFTWCEDDCGCGKGIIKGVAEVVGPESAWLGRPVYVKL